MPALWTHEMAAAFDDYETQTPHCGGAQTTMFA